MWNASTVFEGEKKGPPIRHEEFGPAMPAGGKCGGIMKEGAALLETAPTRSPKIYRGKREDLELWTHGKRRVGKRKRTETREMACVRGKGRGVRGRW